MKPCGSFPPVGQMQERMKKLEEIKDEDIDFSDIPELDESFWENAVVEYPEKKKSVTS